MGDIDDDGIDWGTISEDEIHRRQHEIVRDLEEEAAKEFASVIDKARNTVTATLAGEQPRDHASRGRMYKERMKSQARIDQVNVSRINEQAATSYEGVIDVEDFLHLDYFVKGIAAARCVGRINRLRGAYFGTGFICAPGMLMTNNHVIGTAGKAKFCDVGFETFDQRIKIDRCDLDPERFFFTSPRDELDVTIVALEEKLGAELSEALGWHGIISEQGKIALSKPVAIIQYPENLGKRLVVHKSEMIEIADYDESQSDWRKDTRLWYTSDTTRGSSGSPVFNRNFEVVALHHAGIPVRRNSQYIDKDGNEMSKAEYDSDPDKALFRANQGVRASKIVAALRAEDFTDSRHTALKNDILGAWENQNGQEKVLQEMRERVLLGQPASENEPPVLENRDVGRTPRSCDSVLFEEIIRRVQDGSMHIRFENH